MTNAANADTMVTNAETTNKTKDNIVQVEALVAQVIADNIDEIIEEHVDIDILTEEAVHKFANQQVADKIDETLKDTLGDWLYDNLEIDDETIKSAIDGKIEKLVAERLAKLEDRYRVLGNSLISVTHECIEHEHEISKLNSRIYSLECDLRKRTRTWWEWLGDNW